MFITEIDYVQISSDARKVLEQSNTNNRILAEQRAMERVNSYLSFRYDMQKAFAAEGAERSFELIGLVADIALYYMVLSLPQKMGYEIRKEQFDESISFLERVQTGKASMNLPERVNGKGETADGQIRFGSEHKNEYVW